MRDRKKVREGRREKVNQEAEDITKIRREVLGMFTTGKGGQRIRRVVSNGITDSHDEKVKAELQEKFKPRQHAMPLSMKRVKPIQSFWSWKESLLSQEPGKSPGCGGMRPEYLTAFGEGLDDEELQLLEQFGLPCINGEIPPWLYGLWLTLQTVLLYKTAEREAVRPLGI